MITVVFACVHNAGRSQMAAAFLNSLARAVDVQALSAGTEPAECVHEEVIAVMAERGIDLTAIRPQRLTADLAAGAAWLITMGCGDQCPFIPGARIEDWPLADPRGRPLDEVRAIRDDILHRVQALIAREGWGRS